jgi:hypothetical protein
MTNETPSTDAPEGMTCDFCGATVPQVRRVALDEDYERLQTRHAVRYACPECSAAKEAERSGGGERS